MCVHRPFHVDWNLFFFFAWLGGRKRKTLKVEKHFCSGDEDHPLFLIKVEHVPFFFLLFLLFIVIGLMQQYTFNDWIS